MRTFTCGLLVAVLISLVGCTATVTQTVPQASSEVEAIWHAVQNRGRLDAPLFSWGAKKDELVGYNGFRILKMTTNTIHNEAFLLCLDDFADRLLIVHLTPEAMNGYSEALRAMPNVPSKDPFEQLFGKAAEGFDQFKITSTRGIRLVGEANLDVYVEGEKDNMEVTGIQLPRHPMVANKTLRTLLVEVSSYGTWKQEGTEEASLVVHELTRLNEPKGSHVARDLHKQRLVESMDRRAGRVVKDSLAAYTAIRRENDSHTDRVLAEARKALEGVVESTPRIATFPGELGYLHLRNPYEGQGVEVDPAKEDELRALKTREQEVKSKISFYQGEIERANQVIYDFIDLHGMMNNLDLIRYSRRLSSALRESEEDYAKAKAAYDGMVAERSRYLESFEEKDFEDLIEKEYAKAKAAYVVAKADFEKFSNSDQEGYSSAKDKKNETEKEFEYWEGLRIALDSLTQTEAELAGARAAMEEYNNYRKYAANRGYFRVCISSLESDFQELQGKIEDLRSIIN